MKRVLFTLLLFLPGVLSAQYRSDYASLNDSETVSALKEHVSYLASPSMEGRAAGSAGEMETALYVTQVLRSYGVDILSGEDGDPFGLKQESGDTLTSRNVIGFIPGYDKNLKDKYIVIGARMDNLGTMKMTVNGEEQTLTFNGANGNASGVAMLLELARMLSTNAMLLRRSVIIAAFGASSTLFAGSWYFLNRAFADVPSIEAMVDLDVLGMASGGFYAYTFSNQDMNIIARTLGNTLQPIQPEITAQQPFASDQISFYDKEIPSVLFTTGRYPEYMTHRDVASIVEYEPMERELEYIYNYTVSLVNGPRPIFNVESEARRRNAADEAIPYYDCDRRPSFLGSTDPRVFLEKWVYQYLKYPDAAVRDGIQGKVLVDFIIDEAGKVTDVKVLKGVDEWLDAEAVRVISASPAWKPGYVRGKKVKSEISLYVEFRLEKKKNKR
ncbi:MAG: TonB family protein [Bacteroidales bacterium]|nr:TonB family protein [Bacteroidales bacterium]